MRKPTKAIINKPQIKQAYELYEQLPKTSHKKAKTLMNFVNSLPNVSITPNGAVSIDGREIKNSNISNIISDLILNRISKPPVGAKQLALELKYNNVPIEVITNKNRHSWFDNKISTELKSPETPKNQWRNY